MKCCGWCGKRGERCRAKTDGFRCDRPASHDGPHEANRLVKKTVTVLIDGVEHEKVTEDRTISRMFWG